MEAVNSRKPNSQNGGACCRICVDFLVFPLQSWGGDFDFLDSELDMD